MFRHRFERTLLAELVTAALLLVACDSLFGIDEPKASKRRATGGSDGLGGAAGQAGAPGGAGGEAGAPGGAAGETTGGSAGTASGSAGDAGGGTDSGRGGAGARAGTGGRAGATGGAGVGGEAGGGEGGGENPPEFGTLGEPCVTAGELACPGPAALQSLLCDGERWIANQTCAEHQRCDRKIGVCASTNCETAGTSCWGDFERTCGPDLVTVTEVLCILSCNETTGRCQEPIGGELIIDQPPEIESPVTYWPDPAIPVCVHDESRYASEWSAIRTEVESTWGRYSALVFTGWGECSEPTNGLELGMTDQCDHELVRIERHGYPGPSVVVPVTFCTSYYDSSGTIRQTDLPLFRFVARHAFGDVLAMPHLPFTPSDFPSEYIEEDFMMPWLHVPGYQSLGFSFGAASFVQSNYGHKLPHSFVSTEGRCLSLSSGEFAFGPCVGAPERAFRAEAGRLQHVGTEACVRAGATPGAVESGDCAFEATDVPAVIWEPRRVAWHGDGGRCVTVHPGAVLPDTVIELEPCEPGRDDQAWSFELAGDGVRIRHPSSGYCVSAPESWPSGYPGTPYPILSMSCGAPRDLFEARNGQLSVDRRCLSANFESPNAGIAFRSCADESAYKWNVSGPFQNAAGDALTLLNGVLVSTPVTNPPAPNQIFDYHF
jgi:hypothetical protein